MKITVATVQMVSLNHNFERNLSSAQDYITDAAHKGANLILLPEFALAGYLYTDAFWDMAEPLKGRTYNWQKGLSEKFGVYIGICILERSENDFYDTFLLTGPGKNDVWTHRKIEAPSYESYLFKGAGLNNSVFDTPIGRIGVAICFDSAKNHTVSNLKKGNADIVLLAYSYPGLPRYFSRKDRDAWLEIYQKAPEIYAACLHVPIVVSNKTGGFDSPVPFGIAYQADFAGCSAIFNQRGDVLKYMPMHQAGVLVSEVTIGKENNFLQQNKLYDNGWLLPYSLKTKVIMELNRKIGAIRYKYSNKRKIACGI
ncbi:MAG: carbon-nitrogen hydrolase family protein [Desulfocapsaceae bacterium]|nr:carbon-nitrogen hydrolase family protein [Desulfocapsaceae bacterium]